MLLRLQTRSNQWITESVESRVSSITEWIMATMVVFGNEAQFGSVNWIIEKNQTKNDSFTATSLMEYKCACHIYLRQIFCEYNNVISVSCLRNAVVLIIFGVKGTSYTDWCYDMLLLAILELGSPAVNQWMILWLTFGCECPSESHPFQNMRVSKCYKNIIIIVLFFVCHKAIFRPGNSINSAC